MHPFPFHHSCPKRNTYCRVFLETGMEVISFHSRTETFAFARWLISVSLVAASVYAGENISLIIHGIIQYSQIQNSIVGCPKCGGKPASRKSIHPKVTRSHGQCSSKARCLSRKSSMMNLETHKSSINS